MEHYVNEKGYPDLSNALPPYPWRNVQKIQKYHFIGVQFHIKWLLIQLIKKMNKSWWNKISYQSAPKGQVKQNLIIFI